MSKLSVYFVRDIVSDTILTVGSAPTDGAFIRDALALLLQQRRKEELEFYKIGELDTDTHVLTSVPTTLCSFDSYKFPETTTHKLTKDEIIALASQLNGNKTETK